MPKAASGRARRCNRWKAALPVFRKYSRLASCVSCHSTRIFFGFVTVDSSNARGLCDRYPLRAGILVEPARCSSPRFRTVVQPKRARAVRTRRRAPPSRAPSLRVRTPPRVRAPTFASHHPSGAPMSAVAPAPAPARATFVDRRLVAPRASGRPFARPRPSRARGTPSHLASSPPIPPAAASSSASARARSPPAAPTSRSAPPRRRRSPDLARSDDGAANPELADDAADADHLRTETDGGGGGSGEGGSGDGGEGGSGGSGSGGSGSAVPVLIRKLRRVDFRRAAATRRLPPPPPRRLRSFAPWTADRAGAASLFAANLATWTTMRAAACREARAPTPSRG